MKKWIGWILTLGTLGALMVVIMGRVEEVKEARANPEEIVVPPAAVRVVPVEARDLGARERATGEVRAESSVMVIPKVGGRALEVRVDVGDLVEAGQVLVVLDEGELGWRVKQAEAGAGAARAAVRQASVQLDLARTEFARAKKLHESRALPEADFIRAEGGVKAAEAAVAAARAQVRVAEAALGLASEAHGWREVTAPIAGRVNRRMVEVGQMAGSQNPVFEIVATGTLEVHVAIDPRTLRAITSGARAVARVDAAGTGKAFPLTLRTTGGALDPMTRRVPAVFELPASAAAEGVLPLMLADVEVAAPEAAEVLAAPASSVVQLADGAAVYVVRDGKATAVRVVPTSSDPGWAALDAGAKPGDRVIVEGQLDLRPGAAVRIVDAEAGSASAPKAEGEPE